MNPKYEYAQVDPVDHAQELIQIARNNGVDPHALARDYQTLATTMHAVLTNETKEQPHG